ncbi:hypothetical protein NEH82_03685 [Enterococcus faecium]|nr:hypothetical protein [Enterococcus faecium]UTU60643.1 hypothetical protein NEH82_03685 [Enterococcus faecium]
MSQSFFRINGVLMPTPRSQVTIFNKHEKLFFEIATCDSELNGRLTTSWYKRCSKASFSVLSQIYANDISKQTSDLIDRYYFAQADLIITLCGDAKDKCPAVPNNHEHLHWDLKDPAQAVGSEEEILAEFRKVREVIKRKVLDLNQRTSIV